MEKLNKKDITVPMVSKWVRSLCDGEEDRPGFMTDVLQEIARGNFTPKQLAKEIIEKNS